MCTLAVREPLRNVVQQLFCKHDSSRVLTICALHSTSCKRNVWSRRNFRRIEASSLGPAGKHDGNVIEGILLRVAATRSSIAIARCHLSFAVAQQVCAINQWSSGESICCIERFLAAVTAQSLISLQLQQLLRLLLTVLF